MGYYGGIFADVANALPGNIVFRWWNVNNEGGFPTSDAGQNFYALSANQTCDRIEAGKLTNAVRLTSAGYSVSVPKGLCLIVR